MPWNLDPRVRSAMISDSLDVVGVRNNAMDVRVRALRPGMRAVGLAATVKFVPDSHYDLKDPYGAGIDFLDTLQAGGSQLSVPVENAFQLFGENCFPRQQKVVVLQVLWQMAHCAIPNKLSV